MTFSYDRIHDDITALLGESIDDIDDAHNLRLAAPVFADNHGVLKSAWRELKFGLFYTLDDFAKKYDERCERAFRLVRALDVQIVDWEFNIQDARISKVFGTDPLLQDAQEALPELQRRLRLIEEEIKVDGCAQEVFDLFASFKRIETLRVHFSDDSMNGPNGIPDTLWTLGWQILQQVPWITGLKTLQLFHFIDDEPTDVVPPIQPAEHLQELSLLFDSVGIHEHDIHSILAQNHPLLSLSSFVANSNQNLQHLVIDNMTFNFFLPLSIFGGFPGHSSMKSLELHNVEFRCLELLEFLGKAVCLSKLSLMDPMLRDGEQYHQWSSIMRIIESKIAAKHAIADIHFFNLFVPEQSEGKRLWDANDVNPAVTRLETYSAGHPELKFVMELMGDGDEGSTFDIEDANDHIDVSRWVTAG